MKQLLLFSLFFSQSLFSSEQSKLLSLPLQYEEGSYVDILKSHAEFERLQKNKSTQHSLVNNFMHSMLSDIRHERDILYNKWCGSSSALCKTASLTGCGCASPVAIITGLLTNYSYITVCGTIATVVYIPTIGWSIVQAINTYNHLDVYEHAALQWYRALNNASSNIQQFPASMRME